MNISEHGRFIRLPTGLLEALLRTQLTRTQLRILLWVIRHTYGWNRDRAPFSWYRIARQLAMDRGGIVRAGNALLRAQILDVQMQQLGIQKNCECWDGQFLPQKSDHQGQLWISGPGADQRHRKPMTEVSGSDDACHRFSVDRKTDVKTKRQRRRGRGFVDNSPTAEDGAVRELMNFYGALSGEALSPEQTAAFYKRFRKSATALLVSCSGNLQEATAVLRRSLALGKRPET